MYHFCFNEFVNFKIFYPLSNFTCAADENLHFFWHILLSNLKGKHHKKLALKMVCNGYSTQKSVALKNPQKCVKKLKCVSQVVVSIFLLKLQL